ncbi:ATP-binding protein [Victivallis vadensis]|uniref:ATP-binding protein n=1 Tax=Victivallis vadensis TaxID=172901 RepID=A0A848AX67_9BACT|nr:ATP-binding protein [Victivallis vadensis]NMD85306.1 ATP-binding protein [Victivallis vadensis]
MIQREIQQQLLKLAAMYPVVTITGPRQSGKTTLAKMTFPQYRYVSLENFDIRQMAEADPRGFLKSYAPPVIFDEIQRVPKLLSFIQTAVDEDKSYGQYILTGSHQPALGAGVSQSLAGRTGILQLLPLSISEMTASGITLERDQYLYSGFMPRLYDTTLDPKNLYRDYFSTYVEKDVRQMLNIKDLSQFETFVKLLAGRVGQLVNMASLAGDVGVSSQTLAQWLSVLEASFIVFQLPGYYENFGKRLIKSKKLYFTEVGLATWLLGINSPEQVARDPLFGGLFENMVVIEALKQRFNTGETAELYFIRDSQGLEADLLFRKNNQTLIPVEIKGGMTWNKDFCKNLLKFRKLSEKFQPGFVIYSGDLTPEIDGIRFLNFKDTGTAVK